MTDEASPIANLSDQALQVLLQQAIRNTLILGFLGFTVLAFASGWRTGALFLTGALISAASIFEWQRLIRVINAKLEKQKAPRSAGAVVILFVLRLTIYAGAIYGSLECFRGSAVALLCGLGLAALAIGWEAVRLLRD